MIAVGAGWYGGDRRLRSDNVGDDGWLGGDHSKIGSGLGRDNIEVRSS